MAPSSSFQCFTLTLLILPAIILVLYFLTAFPHIPESLAIHPSLATLDKDCRSWQIYPEDIFAGGAYVSFPYGRVRYWLLGPEDGSKVRSSHCQLDDVLHSAAGSHSWTIRALHYLARRRTPARRQGVPRPRLRCVLRAIFRRRMRRVFLSCGRTSSWPTSTFVFALGITA